MVLDAGFRKGKASVAQWFTDIISLPNFKKSLGNVKACAKSLKPPGDDKAAPAKAAPKAAAKKEEEEKPAAKKPAAKPAAEKEESSSDEDSSDQGRIETCTQSCQACCQERRELRQ